MTIEEMKIGEIEHMINVAIEYGRNEFKNYGKSDYYYRIINRIYGMIDVLSIITGKNYYFNENGLHERATA